MIGQVITEILKALGIIKPAPAYAKVRSDQKMYKR